MSSVWKSIIYLAAKTFFYRKSTIGKQYQLLRQVRHVLFPKTNRKVPAEKPVLPLYVVVGQSPL